MVAAGLAACRHLQTTDQPLALRVMGEDLVLFRDGSDRLRQRQPGDYDVQISQRAVAVHRLERLASSDRGVARLRRMIRSGLRALHQQSAARSLPCRAGDGLVATYTQDTVWEPKHPVPENRQHIDDLLSRYAECVSSSVIDQGGAPHRHRLEHLHQSLAAL